MATDYQQIEILFANSLSDIFATVCDDIDSDKLKTVRSLIDKTVSSLCSIAADRDRQLAEALEKNKELDTKVGSLTREVNTYKRYALSTQVDMIKGNIMIRTSKSAKDAADYICSIVGKSGAPKPANTSFFIQQISTDTSARDKSPKKSGKGDKSAQQAYLYKAFLGGKMKNDFFKGLASNTSTRSTSKDDFQVSHDIPSFLYKQRNLLEKAAYSLRKENKDKDLKTKVSLKGFNLALFVKTKGNPDWVNIENDKVSQLRTTKLEAKEGDPTPPGDVNSLIQSLEKF